MKTYDFSLEFNGYWIEANKQSIPEVSGIYCVYACVYFQDRDTVGLNELLYIGESENVYNRITNHDKDWQSWINYLFEHQSGQTLCYSVAKIGNSTNDSDRKIVEAALIHEHKPPLNKESVEEFPHSELTVIQTSGCNSKLKSYFAINSPV